MHPHADHCVELNPHTGLATSGPVPAALSPRSTRPAAFGDIRTRIGWLHRPKRMQPATYCPGHPGNVGENQFATPVQDMDSSQHFRCGGPAPKADRTWDGLGKVAILRGSPLGQQEFDTRLVGRQPMFISHACRTKALKCDWDCEGVPT
jgi:hypothetical protein